MRPISSNFDAAMASKIGPVMASVSTSISCDRGEVPSDPCVEAAPCCAIFTFVVLVRSVVVFWTEEEWAGLVVIASL